MSRYVQSLTKLRDRIQYISYFPGIANFLTAIFVCYVLKEIAKEVSM